jgi:ppGpp synthetase/RelA/SpoT-type nucleotidyltranferase
MAIPAKGLNQIRTLSGRTDQLSVPYRSYMQISCLEMERARRNMERKSASQRIEFLDARIKEIEKSKQELLQAVAALSEKVPVRQPESRLESASQHNTSGFKIRY